MFTLSSIAAMEDWKFFHKAKNYEAFLKNKKNAKECHAVKLCGFMEWNRHEGEEGARNMRGSLRKSSLSPLFCQAHFLKIR